MIHVSNGDIGVDFISTLKDETGTVIDVSGASTKQIIFLPPSGTALTKTASFVTDGTDGKISYATIAGDMSENGRWEWQAKIVTASANWRSEIHSFKVVRSL